MKRILLFIFCLGSLQTALAQTPVISGDVMLCPWTDGTAAVTNAVTYDTYQWYSKYWFTDDPYEAIPGATSASFTYDWYTYDQSLFKVVTTKAGVTTESNVIQVDSYAWSSLSVGNEVNEYMTFNPDTQGWLLCEGASFQVEVFNPYTIVQWYKNGVAIDGATSMTYIITGPGTYHVVAAPAFCPNSTSNNEGLAINVTADTSCSLGINDPSLAENIKLYPNPATESLTIELPANSDLTSYSIIDVAGKVLSKENISENNTTIPVQHLSNGFYILKLDGNKISTTKKFIKN